MANIDKSSYKCRENSCSNTTHQFADYYDHVVQTSMVLLHEHQLLLFIIINKILNLIIGSSQAVRDWSVNIGRDVIGELNVS